VRFRNSKKINKITRKISFKTFEKAKEKDLAAQQDPNFRRNSHNKKLLPPKKTMKKTKNFNDPSFKRVIE
jgi:hypothetical protein